jgi:hypothetical protein
MSIKILSKVNQYVKNGSSVFVYDLAVETPEELAKFKSSQGDYYRESESKKPLYFSQRVLEPGAELTLTKSGRYQVLTDLEYIESAREQASINAYGKLDAIRQYTGLTKRQLQERLLASF